MVCYRRRGHNEGDDPSMTQPLMYDLIDAKRSVRKLYTEALIGRGDISVEEAEEALRDYQDQLEQVFAETRDAADGTPAPAATPAASRDARRRTVDDRGRRRGRQARSATRTSTCPRASPCTRG